MVVAEYQRGVHLPEAGLWLDARDPRDLAFVSHAHSDHTGLHRRVLCSPATARLMQVRLGLDAGAFETLDFGEIRTFDGWSVKLLPAGHVLGSAQLFYESARGDLLYTGDFKLRKGLSSEGAVATHAETLVMETTYGLPRYQFPPVSQTLEAVVKFCMEALEDGETPVLLGYALGKAQEILAALQGVNLPVMVHASIARIARVYEEFGIVFPPYTELEAATAAGHVLICPPSVNGSRVLRSLRCRVAALTGWAMDSGAVHRLQVDAAFPLSDHADYGDLIQYVQTVHPDRVLTLHGFAQEFARDLRERGVEAWSLTGANQLEFSISMPASPAAVRFSPDPAGPGEDVGFNRFCQVCQAVRESTGKLEKVRRLAEYLCSLEERDLPLAAVWLTGRPFAQRDPHPLNLGGAVIWRALLSASGLSENELRTIARKHNDSGMTAEEAMRTKPGDRALTIAEIGEIIHTLRAARGPVLKTEILSGAFGALPPAASGYLVRIVTGDLRIGLKEGLLEDAIARAFDQEFAAVREAHMLLGDIGRTALLAREGRLFEAELTLF